MSQNDENPKPNPQDLLGNDLVEFPPLLFSNLPAIPINVIQAGLSLVRLGLREPQTKTATSALSNTYTIGNRTATGYQFMYQKSEQSTEHISEVRQEVLKSSWENVVKMEKELASQILAPNEKESDHAPDSLTALSLDDPEQWTMGWTTYPNVYEAGQAMRSTWVATLTDADEATKQFWPTIATYGLAYNLLVLQKVGDEQFKKLKGTFDSVWRPEWDGLYEAGKLYVIDLSIFEVVGAHEVNGFERFTPSTQTLLGQDAESKAITPLAIRVARRGLGAKAEVYSRENATDSAWLYALQAAKTSVTVYGIWLGHVYHWHIVTAAMQWAMNETLPKTHPIDQLLAPQSKYLIGFNSLLLGLWDNLAPPTSIKRNQFLRLCNAFAEGRNYFDDDPHQTLDRLGLDEADFTQDEPWDLYPIVADYLRIWKATADYVDTFVCHTYQNDSDVVNDEDLQSWMALSAQRQRQGGGNIRGLPPMNSREALSDVLTSLIYRITMHGASRLNSDALPAFTFVANFPPCLQTSEIPKPWESFSTKELLAYLPKTGTIGGMLGFYFIFVFSAPYEPFIPLTGIESNLYFEEPNDPRNQALIAYREQIKKSIGLIQKTPQIHQWPLNIET